MRLVRILVYLSVLPGSPEQSLYFIKMRKLKTQETGDLPQVTQGESSKVKASQASPSCSYRDREAATVLHSDFKSAPLDTSHPEFTLE